MKKLLLGFGIAASALGSLDRAAVEARAQYPVQSTVVETVSPGYNAVTYGERVKVRRKAFKTVVRERPVTYVNRTPTVVRQTQLVQPAPVVQSVVVQPPPIVESRMIQQAPVIQNRVYQPDPVFQTRYLSPY